MRAGARRCERCRDGRAGAARAARVPRAAAARRRRVQPLPGQRLHLHAARRPQGVLLPAHAQGGLAGARVPGRAGREGASPRGCPEGSWGPCAAAPPGPAAGSSSRRAGAAPAEGRGALPRLCRPRQRPQSHVGIVRCWKLCLRELKINLAAFFNFSVRSFGGWGGVTCSCFRRAQVAIL